MVDKNCIFCKIAAGEIPSATVYEDDMLRVILDMGPASRGHALILPKEHYADLVGLEASENGAIDKMGRIMQMAARVGNAQMKALGATGFNVVQNNGESAGQTVHHLHVHVIPRYDGGPSMVGWKPGESTPEELSEIASQISKDMR